MPVFYRIVRADPPTVEDFLSLEAQGRTPRRLNPRQQRLATGISVFDTPAAARQLARQVQGRLGGYLAQLTLEEGGPPPLTYELTGASGHFTLWGDPEILLNTVTQVIPITAERGD